MKLSTSFVTLGYFSKIIKRDMKGTKKTSVIFQAYFVGIVCFFYPSIPRELQRGCESQVFFTAVDLHLLLCRLKGRRSATQSKKNMLHRCHLAL